MTHITYNHVILAKTGHVTTCTFSGVGKDNPIEKDSTGRGSKYFEQKYNQPHRTFDKVGHVLLKKMGNLQSHKCEGLCILWSPLELHNVNQHTNNS